MHKMRIEGLNFFAQKQNIELSYSFCIRSSIPGSKIVIVGGLHGNEPVGIDAIIQIHKELECINKGEITFILGNPQAYLEDIRFVTSNLNRCFVPDYPKDYEGYRAVEITNYLKKYQPDYLLDLHSVSIGDVKMEIYKSVDNINKNLYNQDFTQIILSPKVASGAMLQLDCTPNTMAVECGNHNSKYGLDIAVYKIKQLFNFYKMSEFELNIPSFDTNLNPNHQVQVYELFEPIIPLSGFTFVDPNIHSEKFVKKGEIYAIAGSQKIKAKEDLYILMPSKNIKATDTDAGFLARKIVI
jgi:succinylglutamate desuccinylase